MDFTNTILNQIYFNVFDTEMADTNLMDLDVTELALEDFKVKYFPKLDAFTYEDTIENDIREIFLCERQHAFKVGFTAGFSLLLEMYNVTRK